MLCSNKYLRSPMDSVIELGMNIWKIEEDSHLLAATIFPSLSGRHNRIPFDRSPKANNSWRQTIF